MKIVYKIFGWIFLILGGGMLLLPFLVCSGTQNDMQCLVLSIMFSGSRLTLGILLLISGLLILHIKEGAKATVVIGGTLGIAVLLLLALPSLSYKLERNSSLELNETEVVMHEGDKIIATRNGDTLTIFAGPNFERTYYWKDGECTILQQPRIERWHGSMGIYSPSRLDWKPGACGKLDHATVEEGQQHFSSIPEAMDWLKRYDADNTVYTNDGMVIYWQSDPLQNEGYLDAEVWQILINKTKPTQLEGAQDDGVQVLPMVQSH